MTDFALYDETNAPEASRPILAGAKKSLGFIPNLYAEFAEAPAVLEAYTTLSDLFSKTSFSPLEQQVVYLTINYENGCHYCMAAHTSIAQMQKLDADVVSALREGRPLADPKLEALRTFTKKLVNERGWVADGDVQAFLNAGYTKANVVEAILGVGHKTISNYLNHIATTPVDEAFKANEWSKPEPVTA